MADEAQRGAERWRAVWEALCADERYRRNLDWGKPRAGHPEGTVRAHVAELEGNLERLRGRVTEEEYWKLQVLIHTHDSFKAEAREGAAIRDAESHASLARAFLAGYCGDADMLEMVQLHDEPYALYRQATTRGKVDSARWESLLAAINDWDLFVAFLLVDGCTAGKSREPLRWFLREIGGRVGSRFGEGDVWEAGE